MWRGLCSELPLRLITGFALVTQVAAGSHDTAQHVMGEFHSAHVEPILDAQQAAVHQLSQRIGRSARSCQRLGDPLFGQALPISRVRQQLVLDHAADTGRLVRQRALVEFREDRVA